MNVNFCNGVEHNISEYTVFPLIGAGCTSARSQPQGILEAGVFHVKDTGAFLFSELSNSALIRGGRLLERSGAY